MATKGKLEIAKLSFILFILDGIHGTRALADEATCFRCLLESLLAARPLEGHEFRRLPCREASVETYKPCCDGGTRMINPGDSRCSRLHPFLQ